MRRGGRREPLFLQSAIAVPIICSNQLPVPGNLGLRQRARCLLALPPEKTPTATMQKICSHSHPRPGKPYLRP